MSNPPDPAELAKRYVALWQDYLSATAADADLADAMTRFFAALLGAFATYRPPSGAARNAAAAAEPSADGGDRPTDEEESASAVRTEAPGPTAAAAPPEQRGDALADIARRLALIEKRLAALDARTREGGTGPRGFARRRRF